MHYDFQCWRSSANQVGHLGQGIHGNDSGRFSEQAWDCKYFEKEFRNGVKIEGDCCRVHENVDTKEEIRTYWVEFDSEQQDVEGDGPYQAGEIHEEDLECVDKIAVQ